MKGKVVKSYELSGICGDVLIIHVEYPDDEDERMKQMDEMLDDGDVVEITKAVRDA